ncbi:MAG: shikimate kinase I [Halothiobacillus sp. 14-56-357]|jgi:shikimate kinase|uniref:shikimate kinase AroK n=1 Tax=Halothiobacillus sp. 15-55-196 TaxID=1970382 RepID=UPI000BC4B650|nr:shikimate kinase AroK [Halothiobacillus sp. 15-55-196]OZB37142.1 MAG: shikimate kinase I [Halothiobacillus sp. 15-55-196]OZB56498.1 MAG: shikimate kinase I [Halothiobacillus sp. 14-56-357]OZB77914.1 MAG: shikimate kinase I [Halothiobacillus sp. 13-55-115]
MNNIILIGPMGAGKSTIGKMLAHSMNLPFYDSDKEIEHRTGATIPLIFEIEGEAGFRDREVAVIDELTQTSGWVLATGGGAILRPENRAVFAERGFVVYLHATVQQQAERTAMDTQRPLLQTKDRAGKLNELMTMREPLYRGVADLIIETAGKSPKVVVDLIRHHLD